jgi:hypothetical protein
VKKELKNQEIVGEAMIHMVLIVVLQEEPEIKGL